MKKNNTTLPVLCGAAILSLFIGTLLTIRSLGQIERTAEIWLKKGNDLQEMTALRTIASEHRKLLEQYAQYPAAPAPLGELARLAVPGLNLMTRSTETHPSVPGWTAHKVNIGLIDISGDDFGRFLEALTTTTPPWAILDCTLSASPAPGRLAKVELVLETVGK